MVFCRFLFINLSGEPRIEIEARVKAGVEVETKV